MSMRVNDIGLKTLIDMTSMQEIMTHYDAQKPDEFGCRICEHVLFNIEKLMRTSDFTVRSQRLQTDGDATAKEHVKPGSTVQVEEQPSPETVLPSSQPSWWSSSWGL